MTVHTSLYPAIIDILTKHYNKDGRKLELFARNLVPGWTSWGNEVYIRLTHNIMMVM